MTDLDRAVARLIDLQDGSEYVSVDDLNVADAQVLESHLVDDDRLYIDFVAEGEDLDEARQYRLAYRNGYLLYTTWRDGSAPNVGFHPLARYGEGG